MCAKKSKSWPQASHQIKKKIALIVSSVFHENFVVPSFYQNFFIPLLSLSLPLVKICAKISSSRNYHSTNSPSHSHIWNWLPTLPFTRTSHVVDCTLSFGLRHCASSSRLVFPFLISLVFSWFFFWLGYIYSVSRLFLKILRFRVLRFRLSIVCFTLIMVLRFLDLGFLDSWI